MPPKAQQEASALSLLRPVGLPALPMRHGAVLSTCMQDRNLSALPMSAAPCGALACRVEACLLCPPPCPPHSPAVGCCFSVACLVPATCLPPPAICPTCRHRTPTLSSAFSRRCATAHEKRRRGEHLHADRTPDAAPLPNRVVGRVAPVRPLPPEGFRTSLASLFVLCTSSLFDYRLDAAPGPWRTLRHET